MERLVFGDVRKVKRSELVERYQLGGVPDHLIIQVAQKNMAADQRLEDAKKLADQQLQQPTPRSDAPADGHHGNPADQPDQGGADADGLELW